MAAKKRTSKALLSKKKATQKATTAGGARALSSAKKASPRKAKGLLGRLKQRSAQLILDSGLLGKAPAKRATKKKR